MAFIDALAEDQRRLFEQAGDAIVLNNGDYLIRRGDPGGDIYLVQSGALEVVDSRSTPAVILTVLEAGAIVGEMAFLDGAPRSADVRAATEAKVLRWARQDMRNLLNRHPEFAARFFEGLASSAARRIRDLSSSAVSGSLSQNKMSQAGMDHVRAEAQQIANQAKDALIRLESDLRSNPESAEAREAITGHLELLEGQMHELFSGYDDADASALAGEVVSRELRPWLVRSALAERSIRRPQGVTATAEIMSHVMIGTPGGEGQLGEILDEWLLQRPTFLALRTLPKATLDLTQKSLPKHRNRRVMLVNAWTGWLVANLVRTLNHPPTVLTVVDQSKDALAFLGAGLAQGSKGVDLQTVQEDLAQFAMGRWRHSFPAQDTIILHGLLEYMPERIAVSLLLGSRSLLSKDGCVIAGALKPSADAHLIDRLLDWPTIRRSTEALRQVFDAAGLQVVEELELPGPAMLFKGKAKK